jgi:hypothetical protein
MLPTEELFVYVYVLVHDLMLAGAVVVPGRPGPPRSAVMPSCWPSQWCGTCWAGAVSPASWLRSAGTGGHLFPGAAVPERGQPADPLAEGRV